MRFEAAGASLVQIQKPYSRNPADRSCNANLHLRLEPPNPENPIMAAIAGSISSAAADARANVGSAAAVQHVAGNKRRAGWLHRAGGDWHLAHRFASPFPPLPAGPSSEHAAPSVPLKSGQGRMVSWQGCKGYEVAVLDAPRHGRSHLSLCILVLTLRDPCLHVVVDTAVLHLSLLLLALVSCEASLDVPNGRSLDAHAHSQRPLVCGVPGWAGHDKQARA